MPPARELLLFFRVVSPLSRLMRVTWLAIGALSGAVTLVDPARLPDALAPMLLLQLFSASCGFATSARRGYYDLVLTRGFGRVSIAIVQWLCAIVPGLAAFAAVATAAWLAAHTSPSAVPVATVTAAIVLVSTLPWALTVSLPRFSGAIGWLLLGLLIVAVVGEPGAWAPDVHPALGTTMTLVIPTIALQPGVAGLGAFVPAAAMLSVLSMCAALGWIHRMDVPLEAAQ